MRSSFLDEEGGRALQHVADLPDEAEQGALLLRGHRRRDCGNRLRRLHGLHDGRDAAVGVGLLDRPPLRLRDAPPDREGRRVTRDVRHHERAAARERRDRSADLSATELQHSLRTDGDLAHEIFLFQGFPTLRLVTQCHLTMAVL